MSESKPGSHVRWLVVAAMVVGGAISLWWLVSGPAGLKERSKAADAKLVLLISLDTCRADHLGCYGNKSGTTPHIDWLAKRSVVFKNVISPVPMTLPAHSSIMTGTSPVRHGVHDNYGYRLDDGNVTLAELLQEDGFATNAILASFVLDSKFGMDQGFDGYDDNVPEKLTAFGDLGERKGEEVTRLAIEWLEQHREGPAFLFVHYYDPHVPYEAPEPFGSRFGDDLYSAEIAYTDDCVGRLLEWLRQEELYEKSLIVITGDHGEMLGEHEEKTHSYFVYRSAIRVPLIFKLPGATTGAEVEQAVGLIDIAPTICGLAGGNSSSWEGHDLSGMVLGNEKASRDDAPLYVESVTPLNYGANALRGVVTDEWKYIDANRPELYDWRKDPGETDNLAMAHPDILADMADYLQEIVEEGVAAQDGDNTMVLDEASRRNLEALGYVGMIHAGDSFSLNESLVDPKDRIGFHENVKRLAVLVARRRFDEAESICSQMLADWDGFQRGYLILGKIALERGDLDEAAGHLETALRLNSQDVEGLCLYGKVLAKQGRNVEASEWYEEALALDPLFGEAHNGLGILMIQQGRIAEGLEHFREALKSDPRSAESNHNVALALYKQGKIDEAIEYYRRAMSAAPDMIDAHSGLAMSLRSKGRLAEAADCFRQALRLAPDRADLHHNLASILAMQGSRKEAIEHYRIALEKRPEYAQAHNNLGNLLLMDGRSQEAVDHFREAIRIQPDWLEPLNSAAWVLATEADGSIRDAEQAISLAEQAATLSTMRNASILDTLATAYASAGRFEDAIQAGQAALSLAQAANQESQVREIESRLSLFAKGQAYYESNTAED